MAKNKRNASNKSSRNNVGYHNTQIVDISDASGSSGGGPHVSAPAMDPSDLTWLNFDSMDCINDRELHEKCSRVLDLMHELELNLGEFIWAVNFGNEASRAPQQMQTARSQFRGAYLIPTLQNMRIPPRTLSKGKPPPNSRVRIDAYAHAIVGRQFRDEMRTFEKDYGGITSKDLSEDKLLGIDLDKVKEQALSSAPGLFRVLWMLGTTRYRRRKWETNKKQPNLVSLIALFQQNTEAPTVSCIYNLRTCVPDVLLEQHNSTTFWSFLSCQKGPQDCHRVAIRAQP